MKKWILYGTWGCLYIVCAVLGLAVAEPEGLQVFALMSFALLFFVPPVLLLIDAIRQKDEKTCLCLRWISGLSLALTLVLLVANVASALGSDALGSVMYGFLVLVSVPMVCSQHWFLSLFLWACIFFATLGRKQKK